MTGVSGGDKDAGIESSGHDIAHLSWVLLGQNRAQFFALQRPGRHPEPLCGT